MICINKHRNRSIYLSKKIVVLRNIIKVNHNNIVIDPLNIETYNKRISLYRNWIDIFDYELTSRVDNISIPHIILDIEKYKRRFKYLLKIKLKNFILNDEERQKHIAYYSIIKEAINSELYFLENQIIY